MVLWQVLAYYPEFAGDRTSTIRVLFINDGEYNH